MTGDGRSLALAAAAVAGALVPARGSLWWSALVAAAIAALLRWPVAALDGGRAARQRARPAVARRARRGVEPGIVAGEVTLLSDPTPHFDGVRVDVRWGHRRLEAHARGISADALRPRLAGEVITVRGTVRPADPDQPWLVARHIAGELTCSGSTGGARGDPASRLANGLRRTLVAGAAPLGPRARSLYTGLVIGDDREQPADLADSFRGAGLTHLLAVSGQNVAFALALAGPLLRRLRLWPRLARHPRGHRPLRGDDPLRAVRAAGLGDGGAGGDARDAGRSRSRGLRVVGLAVTALCWSIRCSCARPASSCRCARRSPSWCSRLGSRRSFPVPPPLREAAGVTLAAQLGVAPVLLATFGPVPVASLPANLLCVPVAGLVMVWGLTGRPRRRRRPARRWPRSSTSRRALALALARAGRRAHRPRTARASSTSTTSWRWRSGWRSSSWSRRVGVACRRRAARRGSARCSPRWWPPTRPRRCGTPLAPGVVRWHVGGVGRGRARRRGRPVEPRRRRRSSSRCAARAWAPSTCSSSPTRRSRRRSSTSCRGAHRVGATHTCRRTAPPRRARRAGGARSSSVPGRLVVDAVAARAMRSPRGAAVGSAPVEPLPWTVVWQVPCPTVALGPHRFDVRHRALVMGILNRTPDSFFDQGRVLRLRRVPRQGRAARRRGGRLPRRRRGEGRPRSGGRRPTEELERVVPALEALKARFDVPLSVDTWRASVLREALARRRRRGQRHQRLRRPRVPAGRGGGGRVGRGHPHPHRATRPRSRARVRRAGRRRGVRASSAPGPRPPRRPGIPRERVMVDAGLDLGKTRAAVARAAARPRPPGRPRLAAVPVGVEQAVPRRPRRHHGGRSARGEPRRPRPRHRARQPDPPRPRRARRPTHRRRDGRGARRPRRGERMTDASASPRSRSRC